ncbi:hypothetical protein UlMin_042636 [Ulmus minor]
MLIFPLTFFFILYLLWMLKRPKNEQSVRLPPGPKAQIYGPIYKLPVGQKLCVIISSPSLVKEVVRDQDTVFANRNPNRASLAFSFGGNDIAFLPYGPQWRMLRKIFVREMLSSENLNAFYSHRRNQLKKSLRDVYSKVGTPMDVGEVAFCTVMNMITSMFWGGTLDGEEETRLSTEIRSLTYKEWRET